MNGTHTGFDILDTLSSGKDEKALTYGGFYGQPFNGKISTPTTARSLLGYFRDTVYSAAQYHADRVSSVTLRLYNSRGASKKNRLPRSQAKALIARTNAKTITTDPSTIEELERHDAITLLKRPNPYMTGYEYRRYTELYLSVVGASYDRVTTAANAPVQLWLLPPQAVKVNNDPNTGLPRSFGYNGEAIPVQDVLWQTAPNLNDPYGACPGVSPVRAVAAKLQLSDYITEKLIGYMSAHKIGGIISPKSEDEIWTDEQCDRYKGELDQWKHGKAGDWLVNNGAADVQVLAQTPSDLSAIELVRQIEELIARAFRMPLMILRGHEGASRASYEAAVSQWIDSAISPRLREIEEWLNYRYLPLFPNTAGLFFAFDDPSDVNLANNVEVYTKASGGAILTRNEARYEMGYAPVDGADVLLSPAGSPPVYVDEADAPEAPATDVPTDPNAATETEQDLNTNPAYTLNGSQIASAVAIVQAVANGQLPRDAGLGQLQTLVNLSREQAEACMGSVGRTFFAGTDESSPDPVKRLKAQRKRRATKPPVGSELEPFRKILRQHFTKWESSFRSRMDKAQAEIETKITADGVVVKGLPSEFIPVESWAKDLAEDSQPIIELFAKENGEGLLTRVGASPDAFNVFNKEVSQYARNAALKFAESTLKTTTKSMNDALDKTKAALADGLEAGEAIDDLRKRVGEIFEGLSNSRAELIATTESARAWNEGLRESAKASGVVEGFKWLTTDEPCPECEEKNGEVLDINDEMPPLHPGCLCVCEEIIDEDVLDSTPDVEEEE